MVRMLFAGLALLAAATTSLAQLPVTTIQAVFPAGGRPGESVDVQLVGADLVDVGHLVFSHPGIVASPVMREPGEFETGPLVEPNRFHVQIDAAVPDGVYEVRAVGRFGASNPRRFLVQSLPMPMGDQPGKQYEQAAELALPGQRFGRTTSAGIDWYKLAPEETGALWISCESGVVDSPLRPVLVLLDAKGQELDRVLGRSAAAMSIEVHAGETFYLGVADQVYRGGDNYVYRLSATMEPPAAAIYPPVRPSDASNPDLSILHAAAWSPQKAASDNSSDGPVWTVTRLAGPLELVSTEHAVSSQVEAFAVRGSPCRLPSPGMSGPCVLDTTDLPLVVEPLDGDWDVADVEPPAEVVGRFYPHGDIDRIRLKVQEGDEYWIEVISDRLGCPTHTRLIVDQEHPDGSDQPPQRLAVVDDYNLAERTRRPSPISLQSRDPRYHLQAKRDGHVHLIVKDLFSEARDDPWLIYRLQIRRAKPDFQLVAWHQEPRPQNDRQFDVRSPVLRTGQSLVLDVAADRIDGFDAPVDVHVEGLPEGFSASTAEILPGRNFARIVISAPAAWPAPSVVEALLGQQDAEENPSSPPAPPVLHFPIQVVGSAAAEQDRITRSAAFATLSEETPDVNQRRPASRLCQDMIVSWIPEPMPARVALEGDAVELTAGEKLEVPVSITRQSGFTGEVSFSLEGLPEGVQAQPVKLAADADRATLTIDWQKKDTPPGRYTVYLKGTVTWKYSRNPEAVTRLEARQQEFQKQLDQLRGQAKEDQALAEKVQRAEQYAKQIEEQLKAAREASQPRDLASLVYSNGLTINLRPPSTPPP